MIQVPHIWIIMNYYISMCYRMHFHWYNVTDLRNVLSVTGTLWRLETYKTGHLGDITHRDMLKLTRNELSYIYKAM